MTDSLNWGKKGKSYAFLHVMAVTVILLTGCPEKQENSLSPKSMNCKTPTLTSPPHNAITIQYSQTEG